MIMRKSFATGTALGLLLAMAPLSPLPAAAQEKPAIPLEKPEGMTEEAWRALLLKRKLEAETGKDDGAAEADETLPERGGPDETAPESAEPAPSDSAPQPSTTPQEPVGNVTSPEETKEDQDSPIEPPVEPEMETQVESQDASQTEPTPRPEPTPDETTGQTPVPEQRPADGPEAGTGAAPSGDSTGGEQNDGLPETNSETTDPTATQEESIDETGTGEKTPKKSETGPEVTNPTTEENMADKPAEGEASPQGGTQEQGTAQDEGVPENRTPVLDSQKSAPNAAGEEGAASEEDAPREEGVPAEAETNTAVDAETEADATPPQSDVEAQESAVDPQALRQEIRDLIAEEGKRLEMGATDRERRERRDALQEQREEAKVVQEFNDNRTIIQINNEYYVDNSDSDRLVLENDEVYYEELPRGRVREVVVRADGTRLITVRNRYGDILRRVRVTPEGREQVLVFVPQDRIDVIDRFVDPARDLPPLRLTIPVSEYILEAEQVEDPDRYYTFLQQPPVERVERIYSPEEVKRSARIRDKVRRIDLDTVNFAFGSAEIDESEIDELEAIATAIERMLDKNPTESFLIEGHTDAVGSDLANLALSDRRAESVARALTEVFGIPPENLVTQGYGERYLKIDTQSRERENRRVALRRITPLVAPVASAE